MQKFEYFNVKWTINHKKIWKSWDSKILKLNFSFVLKRFQCTLLLNSSLDDGLFYIYFLTLLQDIFWIYIFHSICLHNLMLLFQKSITSPLFSYNSSIFFDTILIKIYYNMENLIFDHVIVEYGFSFKFICNSRNYNCDSPNIPFNYTHDIWRFH